MTGHRRTDPAPDWESALEDARTELRPQPAARLDSKTEESAGDHLFISRRLLIPSPLGGNRSAEDILVTVQGVSYGARVLGRKRPPTRRTSQATSSSRLLGTHGE